MLIINPLWPILISLVGIWLSYRIGYRRGQIAEHSLTLQIKNATPRIGTRMNIRKFPIATHQVTRYAIDTTLYNDGNLVATKIEGEWKLTSSDSKQDTVKPICLDSLPSFLSYPLKHELIGDRIPTDITVDIDLTFYGIDEKGINEQQKSYHATWNYDPKERDMIQRCDKKRGT